MAFRSEAEIRDACERGNARLQAQTDSQAAQTTVGPSSADPGLNLQQTSAVQKAPAARDSENNWGRDTELAAPVWNETHPIHPDASAKSLKMSNQDNLRQSVDSASAPDVRACGIANRHNHRTTHDRRGTPTMRTQPALRKTQPGYSSNAF